MSDLRTIEHEALELFEVYNSTDDGEDAAFDRAAALQEQIATAPAGSVGDAIAKVNLLLRAHDDDQDGLEHQAAATLYAFLERQLAGRSSGASYRSARHGPAVEPTTSIRRVEG